MIKLSNLIVITKSHSLAENEFTLIIKLRKLPRRIIKGKDEMCMRTYTQDRLSFS